MLLTIASNSGLHHDIGLGMYGITKSALLMLTTVCAKDWAADRIRVNAVAPGLIRTDLARPIIEDLESGHVQPNPLNFVGEPVDIGRLVRFLVTEDGRYMTGSVVVIDGGELL